MYLFGTMQNSIKLVQNAIEEKSHNELFIDKTPLYTVCINPNLMTKTHRKLAP